jgi:hypothetical protein
MRFVGGAALLPPLCLWTYFAILGDLDWQHGVAAVAIPLAAALSVELCAQAVARLAGRHPLHLLWLGGCCALVIFLIPALLALTFVYRPVAPLTGYLLQGCGFALTWGCFVGGSTGTWIMLRERWTRG